VVNVICVDLVLFTLIFHSRSHSWRIFKQFCNISDALFGFVWEDRIAMSSSNVARVISCDWGISEVNIRYRKGPRRLPCGTPDANI
jgi:hypothetical protein